MSIAMELSESVVPEPVLEELSAAESGRIVDYFSYQLLKAMNHTPGNAGILKRRWRVGVTAVHYFRTFFFVNSLLDFDPRLIMVTALFLAGKTEDDFIKLTELEKLSGKYSEDQILAAEVLLLNSLNFELKVYHPQNCVHAIVTELKSLQYCASAEAIRRGSDSYIENSIISKASGTNDASGSGSSSSGSNNSIASSSCSDASKSSSTSSSSSSSSVEAQITPIEKVAILGQNPQLAASTISTSDLSPQQLADWKKSRQDISAAINDWLTRTELVLCFMQISNAILDYSPLTLAIYALEYAEPPSELLFSFNQYVEKKFGDQFIVAKCQQQEAMRISVEYGQQLVDESESSGENMRLAMGALRKKCRWKTAQTMRLLEAML